MILMKVFSNVIERKIFGYINSIRKIIKAYAVQIENILYQQILGNDDRPTQWSIPMSDDGKMVGIIALSNNHI
jgi:hypothetical protein